MGVYSHYDGAHNHPVNRALHLIAITVGFSSATDHKIMAVLGLDSNVAVAGTVITFVRIFGCT